MDHPYLQSSKSFGELLRLLREQAQLTQRELAARVGYSDAQINRYEKGARAPNPSVVAARFVKALELEPDSDLAATLIALAHKPTQIALDGPTSEASARLSMSFGNHTHSRTATLPQAAYSLVGRSAEWSTLLAVWQRTQLRPQLVLINGEAGIGKSRLAEEMLHWATAQGFHAAQTRAYSAEGRLAYGPIAELLRSPSIRPSLARLDDVWAVEVARIVPELQVERPKLVRHSKFDGAIERLRFFEALARAMFFDANPTLLVIDDLQWCDQETLEWLRFALRFESPGRLMIIGTVRSYELVPSDIISRTLDSLRDRKSVV